MEQHRLAANLLCHMTVINHNCCEVLCYGAVQPVLGKGWICFGLCLTLLLMLVQLLLAQWSDGTVLKHRTNEHRKTAASSHAQTTPGPFKGNINILYCSLFL
ncbi:hypothetical protein ATANTOWER_001325 [Ataeniobius toweri]|uniref:Uncharacterized protein n=1 Tax=Ataeniobius toweri TaxID=208326 RepID=A0ABU7BW04_9TELE|nr:hypothetical protein [Ataeniobius toweri]